MEIFLHYTKKKSFLENEYGHIDCANINSSLALSKNLVKIIYTHGEKKKISILILLDYSIHMDLI